MTKTDFMSIMAVRSPEVQALFLQAIDGKLTKSHFVEAYMVAPHIGRNHKKAKGAKSAVFHADELERYFGWIWHEPEAKNEWQEKTAKWIEKTK